MPESPIVGIRFPDDLLKQVDALVGVRGKNRSHVILNLVKQALNSERVDAEKLSDDRLTDVEQHWTEALNNCLTNVEQQLEIVEQRLTEAFNTRLTSVEQRLKSVEQRLTTVQQKPSVFKTEPVEAVYRVPGEPTKSAAPLDEAGEWLTLQQVCQHYGLNYSNIHKVAAAKGLDVPGYLQQQTRHRWEVSGVRNRLKYRVVNG